MLCLRMYQAAASSAPIRPPKNSARLQRVDAEDLARIGGIGRPIIDDVQNFGAENPAQNDNDSKVPSFLAIDPATLELRTLIHKPINTPEATRKPYVGRLKRPSSTSRGNTMS